MHENTQDVYCVVTVNLRALRYTKDTRTYTLDKCECAPPVVGKGKGKGNLFTAPKVK